MKRLRDEVSSDPLVAQAQALLAQVEPVATDPARRQRVRARLLHHPRRKRGRILTVALVLASGAAMASTLAVRVYHARHVEPSAPPASHVSRAPAVARAPAIEPPPMVDPPVEAPPMVEPRPETAPAPKPVRHKHVAAAPSEEESALLIAAVQALRRDHDAERAGVLIDDYLRRFEHGALAEEALALAIEAAAARGDERAADFGADYLGRFPNGRFRAAAENARARFGK